MGLLDQVIGSVAGGGGKSTSPLTKALLVLLAAKAASSYFGKSGASAAPAGGPAPVPTPSGRIETGVLAGLPSLDSMLDHFRGGGHDDKVKSWIGTGPNKPIEPAELKSALGEDTIAKLERESGLSREELLRQLSTALPQVVDKLTPDGRLPAPTERAHW